MPRKGFMGAKSRIVYNIKIYNHVRMGGGSLGNKEIPDGVCDL